MYEVRCDFPYCMFCLLGYGGFWDILFCLALDVAYLVRCPLYYSV